MFEIKKLEFSDHFTEKLSREKFVEFLFTHLEQFGDSESAINKAIDYAFSKAEGKGGYLLVACKDDKIVGELIMNKTGMSEYIPENILVYIAVDPECRGMGIGGKIIDEAIKITDGDIALHVEYENPAKRLYERKGFTNKYAEMRLIKGD